MNSWRKLGLAGLASVALALGAQRVDAACIDTNDNTVANPGHCLFATGGNLDACRLAIAVDMDGAGAPPIDPKKITCTDGDPLCDDDGAINGSCSFRVGACVNIPNAGCDTDQVDEGVVLKPSQKEANDALKKASAVYNRDALQEALDGLLPAAGEACTDANVPVRVDLKSKGGKCSITGGKCTGDQQCDPDGDTPTDSCVFKVSKSKVNVSLNVTDSADDYTAKFKLTCVPSTAQVAEAFKITNPDDLIGGPLAMGRTGDFMIRNGNVRAVVRDAGREHSFMLLNGGQIIDADIVRTDGSQDRDSWQGIQPLVNISSSQATDEVVVLNDGSNPDLPAAIIHSEGPDDLFDTIKGDILVLAAGPLSVPKPAIDVDLPIERIETDIMLSPYSNIIQFATTITNNTGAALNYYIGDFINPGGQLEPFGPGQGYGESQLRNGSASYTSGQALDFLAFQGHLDAEGVTYGIVFPGAPPSPLNGAKNTGAFASSGVYAWTYNQNLFNTLVKASNDKPPGGFNIPANGGKRTLRRWFVVGENVADITKARTELFAKPKAALQGYVTAGGVPAVGAHVTLTDDNRNNGNFCDTFDPNQDLCEHNIVTSTLTDERGFYRFVLPEGEYNIAVRKAGTPYVNSDPTPVFTPVVVEAKKTTVVATISLPTTGSVTVNVVDQDAAPIAAKVSVVGVPKAADPLMHEWLVPPPGTTFFTGRFFGYDFEEKGDVFGLATARFADQTGTTGAFDLEPGTYHVVVSHGYEFDVYDEIIELDPGESLVVNADVTRVIDTTGFVSIDTHVHMINSPDSAVSLERRIVSMLAEGVDFFANTDHDFAHELSDDVAAMGVSGLIKTAPSSESTTSHYGHFNIWPVTVDTDQVNGGAVDWSAHNDVGPGYPSEGSYDSLPTKIYSDGDAHLGTQVIQINHFNSGTLGHFNSLGIDTEQNPPTTSNAVYRCVGGAQDNLPCRVPICIGGGNDGNTCTSGVDCPGGGCAAATATCPNGGGVCTPAGNLSGLLRLDPSVANLYGDNYTALEVWIEAGRGQTATFLSDNMGDWFNLMNQGRFKTGIADSDTHSSISVQAGGPRTFVASATDDPGLIDTELLAQNVNAMRAIGSNGPFMRVELENGTTDKASHALGSPRTVEYTAGVDANFINLHIESPTWAEYDQIDVYMNSTPDCESEWTFFGVVNPSKCGTVVSQKTLNKAAVADSTHFEVDLVPGLEGGTRLESNVTIPVTITEDTWIVVVVRGTDGVSRPLFPMQPQDLTEAGNTSLGALTDGGISPPWNLGENGATALAFSNPLFFDDGDGLCHGGTSCPGL